VTEAFFLSSCGRLPVCCRGCKALKFCSEACQRVEWWDGGHRHVCSLLAQQREEREEQQEQEEEEQEEQEEAAASGNAEP